MPKKKICHIITKLELGGAQQNTLYTVSHLDREIFTPVMISGKGGLLDIEAAALPGVKTYFLPCLVRAISPLKDICAFFKLWGILKKEKPDIVHTHSSKAGILGRWAAWFAGVPVIIHTFHGFGFHDFQNPLIKALYVLSEKLTAKITHKFIAVSMQNIDKGLKNKIGIKENYILIRSGIDIEKYKNCAVGKASKKTEFGIPQTYKVVTTTGPFKPQKNTADFIKVAKLVLEKYPDCIFVIIGDGAQRTNLENLIRELNISSKIKLLGWRRDIPEILAISDIFVMTSLWEGLPRSVLEAMCCGVPTVANSIDGVKEVVENGKNGYLTQPFDTAKMSENILNLLSDETLSKSMGQAGKSMIDRQFDINYMVKQQEDLYAKLLENQ